MGSGPTMCMYMAAAALASDTVPIIPFDVVKARDLIQLHEASFPAS